MLFAPTAIPQGLKAGLISRALVGDKSPTCQAAPCGREQCRQASGSGNPARSTMNLPSSQTPTANAQGAPRRWNQPRRGTLIISRLSVLRDGAGVINRCRTRKGFQSRRLLSVPKEKSFPSARSVFGSPDRPREEIPRRRIGWAARPGRKRRRATPAP